MKAPFLTPTRLRLILTISLFVITVGTSVIFALVNDNLRGVAIDASHFVIDAGASDNNLQSLNSVKKDLVEKKVVVERARSIVAESRSYLYQEQIINDLSGYAGQAGIAITNLDFTQATAAPSTGTPPAGTAVPVPSGVKSTSVSVTLKNPVPYDSLLRFIKAIEQNLTKMQISKVGLSRDPAGKGVTSEALTIEVYIR